MAHAQKPDFVFRRNGRVHLNRRGHQFSRLLAAEVCASAVVMLDTPCSEVVWRVLATHSICQFPLHFPSRASPCAITFQLESNTDVTPLVCVIRHNPQMTCRKVEVWLNAFLTLFRIMPWRRRQHPLSWNMSTNKNYWSSWQSKAEWSNWNNLKCQLDATR